MSQRILKTKVRTILEVAEILKEGVHEHVLLDSESQAQLALWLEELEASRRAIYDARVALAKARGY